jgi:RNA polymerase sigma factor FliA
MSVASETDDAPVDMRGPVLPSDLKSIRTQLILEHLPQVKKTAWRMLRKLPPWFNLDDLVSTGILGLIAAVDRYDAQRGVSLKSYVEHRIRGAILDSLRELDWAPRSQRRRSNLIEEAIRTLEQRLSRTASEMEIATLLGISVHKYREWLVQTRALRIDSPENAGTNGDHCDLLRYLPDSNENWPSQILERAELASWLAEELDRMPQIEKTVLSLWYYEELTHREIGEILGLESSRIAQLKSQAILRLRTSIGKRMPDRSALRSNEREAQADSAPD